MSEDIRIFVHPDAPRWKLSAQDDEMLAQLHGVLWRWLWAARAATDVIALGHILGALEDLIAHGLAPGVGECEINQRIKGEDGFGAHMSTSPEALMFSLTEYVWMGGQGHDHGSIFDPEGRPFDLELTPKGSFDAHQFALWLDYAERAAPSSVGDGRATVTASWYS